MQMARYTMKFGGTSVGSAAAIAQVAQIVGDFRRDGHEIAVIVSAMSGVTDSLLDAAKAAAAGDQAAYRQINADLLAKHEAAARELIDSPSEREAVLDSVRVLAKRAVGTLRCRAHPGRSQSAHF